MYLQAAYSATLRLSYLLNCQYAPHLPTFDISTHQSAKIGEWFKRFGVNAITVSSVQMAEYFAANGWNDITIAISLNPLEILLMKVLKHREKHAYTKYLIFFSHDEANSVDSIRYK